MAVGIASPTALNVLAGVAGQGGTPNLAWFAPPGTTPPTDAVTALPAAWLTAGYCAETGLTILTNTSTQDVNAFGVFSPIRTIITGASKTATVVFLETNQVTTAVYRRLPLPGQAGSAALVAATGALSFTEGQARIQSYSAVFTATDGVNITRKYCPLVQVTATVDEVISQQAATTYGVTLTMYPDSAGNSVYTYMVVPNLGTV